MADKMVIPSQKGLDQVNVYFENVEIGKGRVIIVCWDMAWTAFWGAMGDRNIQQFFLDCDADYIVGNLTSGQFYSRAERQDQYVKKIVQAVQAAMRLEKAAA